MSAAAPDDAELVAGVLAGDRDAFARVYERYADRLYDFAFSMVRNHEEAADCVADSFVLMAEKLGQLRDPSRLRPWLYSVVRNECLRQLRGRSRVAHDAEEQLSTMADQAGGPEREAEHDELRDLVWAAAAGLGDRDRALLDLHLRQGLDGAELAAAMDVTPANAYVMLNRMRGQVERSLGALLIAHRGSRDCEPLGELLQDWDGRFSPLIRKRVARHIDACDTCEGRRKVMVSPLALLAAVPVVSAPAALRDRVLDDQRLVAFYVEPGATAAAPTPGAAGPGIARRAVLVGLVAVLLALGGWGVVAWSSGTPDDLVAKDVLTTAPPTEDEADPAPPSTLAPTGTTADEPEPQADPTASTAPTGTSAAEEPSASATTDEPATLAPAVLEVSTRTLDLGARTSSGSVRLSNTGGSPLQFSVAPRTGWLDAQPGSGSLAPGAGTTLRIRADRSGLPEGESSGQVAVTWGGGTVLVTVRATRLLPPRVGAIQAGASSCSVPVSAAVTDGSGVRSVRVSWSGAVNGQASASPSGGRWQATIPVTVGGNVKVTFTATDDGGLRTTASRTFTFDPCPG